MSPPISVLITGVAGFIGSALARYLGQHQCARVRGIARHVDRRLPADLEQVAADLTHDTDFSAALQGIEVVIHSAARVHVAKDSSRDPLADFRKANVASTLNLARQAAAAGARRFVFLSSIKVNGEATLPGQLFRPDDAPAPADAYGISKYEAELGLFALAEETGVEVVVIRPPLVYGPAVKGNFAAMVRWIRTGWPLPLGSVHNLRSLVALDNLVSFIALCADPDRSTHAANQIFLISDGIDESTPGLVRKIAGAYGVRAHLLPVPTILLAGAAGVLGKSAAAHRLLGSLQVDSSKAGTLLGWRPVVSMDEQLESMVKHDTSA